MAERLYRSRSKKVIAGVGGGLGEYLNIDPVIIRVLFIIITLINGFGLLLYVILWIVVKEEPRKDFSYEMGSSAEKQNVDSEPQSDKFTTPTEQNSNGKGAIVIGVVLIALGFIFLADNWFPSFHFRDIFPLAILGAGIWLVVDSLNKRETKNENR